MMIKQEERTLSYSIPTIYKSALRRHTDVSPTQSASFRKYRRFLQYKKSSTRNQTFFPRTVSISCQRSRRFRNSESNAP